MTEEFFPIVNDEGVVIGRATRRECHSGSMLLHPVVHLHIFDSAGRILLQRRSLTKDIQPGKWDTAVGGHVDYGEDIPSALRREVSEELGFVPDNPRPLVRYQFQSDVEREMVNVFHITVADGFEPHPDPGEIDEVRFWTLDEVSAAMGKGILTPNFEQELRRILPLISATAHDGQ